MVQETRYFAIGKEMHKTRKSKVAANEELSPVTKKPRLVKEEDAPTRPIPQLPEDIFRLIFGNLTTEERFPLGFVSKRIRRIDLDVGNRMFDDICVFLDYQFHDHIVAKSTSFRHSFEDRSKKAFIDSIPRNFFKNASTECLSVYVEDDVTSRKALEVCTAFNTLKFKGLYLMLGSSTDVSDFINSFCSTLLNSQSKLIDVTLHWILLNPKNIPALRLLLQQFPKICQISLETPFDDQNETRTRDEVIHTPTRRRSGRVALSHFLCDGPTMLHLIKNTKEKADLGSVDCTAEEIMEAFEIICESPIITKRVTFVALESVVDQLFALAQQRPGLEIDEPGTKDREFFDNERGGILYIDDDFKDPIHSRKEISMYKEDFSI